MPKSLQDKVVAEYHDDHCHGHGGIRKTVMKVRSRYYFKHIRKAVTRYVNLCVACQRAKSILNEADTPLLPIVATVPFRTITIDLCSPGLIDPDGWRYILTVVCMCTKWVCFLPLKTKYSAEVMAVLIRAWFHTHGVPATILSDRGKEFLGVVSTVCSTLGIH